MVDVVNENMLLPHIAREIFGRPHLILPEKLSIIVSALEGRIGVDAALINIGPRELPPGAAQIIRGEPDTSRFVGSSIDEDTSTGRHSALPYMRTENGVAVLTVTGSLVNRGAWLGSKSGLTSYEGIKHQLASAVADPKVTSILIDLESPGGQASGAFELAAAVRAARDAKPVTAVVNGMAASAGYAIASGAGRIVTTASGVSGSIGVVLMHADYSRALDRMGVTPTMIHAGAKKVEGNPYEPLSADTKASLQAEVDGLYDLFVETVAAGRKGSMTPKGIRGTEAGIFTGRAAKDVGLADDVGTFEDVLGELTSKSRRMTGAKPAGRRSTMELTQADLDRARAEGHAVGKSEGIEAGKAEGIAIGATAERERVAGILGCEEAKDRSASASHIALKTGMSVEDARGVLAGVEAKPAAAAPAASRSASSPIGLVVVGDAGAQAGKPKLDHSAIFATLAKAENRA